MSSNGPEVADDAHLRRLLAPWVGARAKVLWIWGPHGRPLGNHGDWLMQEVTLRLLDQFGISICGPGQSPDLLLAPPSGALVEHYAYPDLLRERLAREDDLPLVIFPSSAYFPSTDPGEIWAGRRAETLLILREPASYEHLLSLWGGSLRSVCVRLALDHDVVAIGRRHLAEIFGEERREGPRLLVAARLDREQGILSSVEAPASAFQRAVKAVYEELPSLRLRRAIRRQVTSTRQQRSNEHLLEALPQPLRSQVSDLLPESFCRDISEPTIASRRTYLEAVRTANLVVTDRLHVAMPAALLGASVYLVDSGYHKLRGVYEHSLAALPNIQLLRHSDVA